MLKIRPAQENDANSIAQIIQDAFQESAEPQRIHDQILHTSHLTLVTARNGEVVGFVDGFRTMSLEGDLRMELDLMAVAPSCFGQGVGSDLMQAFVAHLPGDVKFVRALVAVDNQPMQRICTRFGFEQSALQSLYVQQASQLSVSASHFVPVQTLTYSGLWLEGAINRNEMLRLDASETIGAVVSSESDAASLLEEANFIHVKDYHWWTKAL